MRYNPIRISLAILTLLFPARYQAAAEENTPPHLADFPVTSGTSTQQNAKPVPLFSFTPPVDLSGKHDFAAPQNITADASAQLKGLCTLAEFNAQPQSDRHVWSFDAWPDEKASLGKSSYTFNFHLGTAGVTDQKIAISSGGSRPETHILSRAKVPDNKSSPPGYELKGLGNIGWGGSGGYAFKFDRPVMAFACVVRSSKDCELRKFYWPAAHDLNGYPVSYTLSDGTVVNLGVKEERGALIKGGTNTFVGVIDRSGRGIVSVSFNVKGGGNGDQDLSMDDLAFVTTPKPASSPLIGLRASHDFYNPESIVETPSPQLKGLSTLDDFRFIVGTHRYVYQFDVWPKTAPDPGTGTTDFAFDLRGKGEQGEKITITAANAGKNAKLQRIVLKNDDGSTTTALDGLGDVAKSPGGWAEQTFKFEKPVWSFGVTYRSPSDLNLAGKAGDESNYPVSYTLSDGTVVNLGASGASGGVIAGKNKTFVGIVDKTDKGIASVTVRVQGTAAGSQPVYIEDLAFALSGPPPGDWKVTLDDEFNGDKLDPKIWTPGYTFPDIINNELQAYVPENIVVADGTCTIKIEEREAQNVDRTGRKGGVQKFASGAFTSFDKWTQIYGYFEARIKMSSGAGTWPAFWLLPDRGNTFPMNQRCAMRSKEVGFGSEIDIFEFMPWWKSKDGLFIMHSGAIWSYGKVTPTDPAPHAHASYSLLNDGYGPQELWYPAADTEFHTYGLYWSKDTLIYYLDSKPVFRVVDPDHTPNVPEYVLFNCALSGNGWGKSPDKKNPTMEQIKAGMPGTMQIDYFRAYSGTLDE